MTLMIRVILIVVFQMMILRAMILIVKMKVKGKRKKRVKVKPGGKFDLDISSCFHKLSGTGAIGDIFGENLGGSEVTIKLCSGRIFGRTFDGW